MKLPEITPGDWKTLGELQDLTVAVMESEDPRACDGVRQICHVAQGDYEIPGYGEAETNARAIAAVPQLLAALREMVIANHGLPINPEDETDPVCRAALESARAALIAAGATE